MSSLLYDSDIMDHRSSVYDESSIVRVDSYSETPVNRITPGTYPKFTVLLSLE